MRTGEWSHWLESLLERIRSTAIAISICSSTRIHFKEAHGFYIAASPLCSNNEFVFNTNRATHSDFFLSSAIGPYCASVTTVNASS